MTAAAISTLEAELRDAVAARDLDAIARCDDRARELIATALAAAAHDARAPASLARLRDLYVELIREVTQHREALGRAVGAQRKRRRDVAAYRSAPRASGH